MDKASKIIAKADSDSRAACTDAVERLSYNVGMLSAEIRSLCAELKSFDAPPAKTMLETEYCGMVVHFDYQPPESATHWEPGCDADVDVCAVYANGMDVIEYLDEKILDQIKMRCFEEVDAQKDAADDDYAYSRYQDRIAA